MMNMGEKQKGAEKINQFYCLQLFTNLYCSTNFQSQLDLIFITKTTQIYLLGFKLLCSFHQQKCDFSKPHYLLQLRELLIYLLLITRMLAGQQGYQYQNNIDTSDMCADTNYFLVLPFTAEQANNPTNQATIPFILTYVDEQTKIYSLMKEYQKTFDHLKQKYLYFTYRNGDKLYEQMTAQSMKKQLGRQSVNGLVLFVKEDPELHGSHYEDYLDGDFDDIYIDQKCVIQYLQKQEEFGNNKKLSIFIQIPSKNKNLPQVFTLKIDGQSKIDDLKKKIINQMKKQFYNINLQPKDIIQLLNKDIGKAIKHDGSLIQQRIKNRNSTIVVKLANPLIQLKRIKEKDYNSYIIIYKEGQVDPRKFKYNEISQLTFNQIYNIFLQLQESKRRKDLSYGLKIMDIIIKPNDKMNLAEKYFKNQSNQPRNIVAKVINEKMVFYHMIPDLLQREKQFKLDDYIEIPPTQKQKRRRCRELSEQRAISTQNLYFKKSERLQPILIYTSQLSYYQSQNKLSKIYESLNRFLRDTPLLTLEIEKLRQEWRYIYSSALLTHLNKIQKWVGITYRGISYEPKVEKGQIVTFKQFLSTSVNRQTAINFATKNANPIKFLFELKIIQGYPIEQFSQFSKEKEVLLQPFADFQVTQIRTGNEQVYDIVTKKTKSYTFKTIVLNQILTPKRLPDIKANFIVWVDQNTSEGFNIYRQIMRPTETTLLVQLVSTEELAQWLKKNKYLFNEPTANLIFISNMTRKEGNTWNEIAGIQGLNQIRKYSKEIPVLFYIGDIAKANKKITENKVNTRDILVGCTPKQVFNYISMLIGQNN